MKRKYSFSFAGITLVLLFYSLFGSMPAFSQDYIFDVDVIGVEDGLPHRNAFDIVQDAAGFIWVSTIGGISRYDGYSFKTYSHSFLQMMENSTAYLAIDHKNRLWYHEKRPFTHSLGGGVIDIRKDTLYSMAAISEGRFTAKDVLLVGNLNTNNTTVFIVTRPGVIYTYNDAFEEIYRFPHPVSHPIVCEAAPDGSYRIFYDQKMICVKDRKRLQTIRLPDQVSQVNKVITSSPDLIVETYDASNRIGYWKWEEDAFVPFVPGEHPGEKIKDLLQLHKDYTVYATETNLRVRDKQGNIIYSFEDHTSLKLKKGLQSQNVFLDVQHNLWMSTGDGLLKMTSRKNPFTILAPKNSIRAIFKEDNQLWTGGYSGNTIIDLINGAEKPFLQIYDNHHTAMTTYKDSRGHIWIGTDGTRFLQYIPEQDHYIHYRFDLEHSLHLPFQNTITKNYWMGTEKGLFRLNAGNTTMEPVAYTLPTTSAVPDIRQFYQNERGIWIATNKGIFLMDAESEIILRHYTITNGLPADNINHIYEDNNGIFWLGTRRSGLVRWDITNNNFRQYTQNDGLSNNNIYAVYEDDFETLWLPSDYGLMAFDKNTTTTKVYLPQNGIAHEEFNTFAHFQDKDGTLYLGGLNGITKFHPRELRQENPISPSLYATKVRVLEKDASEFTDKTSAYIDEKEIRLNANDRILKVELTLLDYENSAENQYAYKLTGHHNQWIYINNNILSIINPPYGHYDLIIKARGASGSWSDTTLTIPIHVPLPFYFQWWFIVIVIMVLAAGVVLFVRQRVQKLQKDRVRLEKEVQKRTYRIEKDKQIIGKQAEELKTLDIAKTRFFTNITHEFRTPLTLILGPAEQVTANEPPEALMAKMQSIKNNSRHLLGLINQLLDISKLESGQMRVKASTADIVNFTKELVQGFQPVALGKEQELIFNSTSGKWETHFDAEKLNRILYNLLSNAIKYTPEKGVIALSLSKKEGHDKEQIEIRVKDSGIGIAATALPHIFNRFYQADDSSTRKVEGTGIGLALVRELVELQNGKITVESEAGKGSIFTVMIPVLPPPLHPDASFETFEPEFPLVLDKKEAVSPEKQCENACEENKLELLIIEDNAQMRNYIRSCMDPSVYNISEAKDGAEGIAKAQETVPDLIISDIMMPKKDGFEVTRAIRNHVATSHIPLILLTAKASQKSRLEGLERGADAYLTKPFSPKELALRIKKLIELRQLMQKRYQSPEPPKAYAVLQKEDRFISELKNYITEHIGEPDLSGEFISQHFAMSRMQLHRKLKAILNSDASSYVRSVRLDTALRLLKEKQLNIAEIAYETGFSSPDHFSRSFKKVYGKPPSKI